MLCSCCSSEMEEGRATFTVVKDSGVYVVENVPCLKCPNCEHIVFRQDVAKSLERYVSGRIVPQRKAIPAWFFRWGDPIIEIPKEKVWAETKNIPIPIGVMGTTK